jgi:hypothetical protein
MKTFLSYRLYGTRPVVHLSCYHMVPGHLFIEVSDWTLELDYEPSPTKALRGLVGRVADCVKGWCRGASR